MINEFPTNNRSVILRLLLNKKVFQTNSYVIRKVVFYMKYFSVRWKLRRKFRRENNEPYQIHSDCIRLDINACINMLTGLNQNLIFEFNHHGQNTVINKILRMNYCITGLSVTRLIQISYTKHILRTYSEMDLFYERYNTFK